ncbi:L-serine ammonia-lyase, iron-sulfur-dependent, subunit alpha [Desulforamulus ruminis]|uniref:L-serine dehydratase n=1 Tax=Desulforamulus ruminis (strain ATCC 23193 / DSM 2154 / NCIMB 8452 / DL) TaxID=696281 RepID=F6DSF4_DESRL|nr:L-serine ammonia-lyase, iron-sulfur-dependent, subunit alpha [Desulforamulus ruminis]AEG61044.1 L-serine dehydratase, iron-sulfur-dependent, alpha subunit [Desulforamulus ruminis DSM 2154]
MKYHSVAEFVQLAEEQGITLGEVALEQEVLSSGRSREDVYAIMEKSLSVMEQAVERGMKEAVYSRSGLTGGDAQRLKQYADRGKSLSQGAILDAVNFALATSEVNASMGLVVATPTAGSSGVLPGCLLATGKKLGSSREKLVYALFNAGGIGFVIANNATISGAAGGCQAEVGAASAMAASAMVELAGGTPAQCAHGAAMALKNLLGLVCDPVAGLVEVPCVKRNSMGAAVAVVAADMALAGITSVIPCDEVIEAMYKIGTLLPSCLRETSLAGLATTPTGKALDQKINSGHKD